MEVCLFLLAKRLFLICIPRTCYWSYVLTNAICFALQALTGLAGPNKLDDLISFGHVLAFLFSDNLPWWKAFVDLNLIGDLESYLYLKKTKRKAASKLWVGLPKVFRKYYEYVVSLEPGMDIDYERHIKRFRKYASKHQSSGVLGAT